MKMARKLLIAAGLGGGAFAVSQVVGSTGFFEKLGFNLLYKGIDGLLEALFHDYAYIAMIYVGMVLVWCFLFWGDESPPNKKPPKLQRLLVAISFIVFGLGIFSTVLSSIPLKPVVTSTPTTMPTPILVVTVQPGSSPTPVITVTSPSPQPSPSFYPDCIRISNPAPCYELVRDTQPKDTIEDMIRRVYRRSGAVDPKHIQDVCKANLEMLERQFVKNLTPEERENVWGNDPCRYIVPGTYLLMPVINFDD